MNAKYFGGNDSGNGEAVENVDKGFPGLDITSSFTFIVETIHYHPG